MLTAIGEAIHGQCDNWIVDCPKCYKSIEYSGYFDKDDICECDCGCKFKTIRVWLDDETYIE
mgnify:CR=1